MVKSRNDRRRSGWRPLISQDDEETVFVGMRVSELPVAHVPSIKGECHRCHEAIWVSKKDAPIAFQIGRTICIECLLEQIDIELPPQPEPKPLPKRRRRLG